MTKTRDIFSIYRISPISDTHVETLQRKGVVVAKSLVPAVFFSRHQETLVALRQLAQHFAAEHLVQNLEDFGQVFSLHVGDADAFHEEHEKSTIEHVVTLNKLGILRWREIRGFPGLEEGRPALRELEVTEMAGKDEKEGSEAAVGLGRSGEVGELLGEEEEEGRLDGVEVERETGAHEFVGVSEMEEEVAQTGDHGALHGQHLLSVSGGKQCNQSGLARGLVVEEEPVVLHGLHAQPQLADAVQQEEVGALQRRRARGDACGDACGCGGHRGLGGLVDVDEVGDVVKEELHRQDARRLGGRRHAQVEELGGAGDLGGYAQLTDAFEESQHIELEGGDIDGVAAGGDGAEGEELRVQRGSGGGESGGGSGRFVLGHGSRFECGQELVEGESGEESDAQRNASQVFLQQNGQKVEGGLRIHAHHRNHQLR